MINYIHGILSDVGDKFIVVEAGGVGYGINVPATVIFDLPPAGTEVKIYTHFSVKEDGQSLYGFLTKDEREMFRSLLTVNGVGPKGALGILSVLDAQSLRMAIAVGDVKSISSAPGIGRKTAERVIIDLKDKVGSIESVPLDLSAAASGGRPAVQQRAQAGIVSETIDALTVLGYSRMEAGKAVSSVEITDEMTSGELLKLALKAIR